VIRVLLRVLFLLFFLRLLLPLLRGLGRMLRPHPDTEPARDRSSSSTGYSDLTPYEIEDADYEEVEEGK